MLWLDLSMSFLCGSGWVLLFVTKVQDLIKSKVFAPLVVIICFMAVPLLMAFENWDDHDRSGRYTAQSMAKSYLAIYSKRCWSHDFYHWGQ